MIIKNIAPAALNNYLPPPFIFEPDVGIGALTGWIKWHDACVLIVYLIKKKHVELATIYTHISDFANMLIADAMPDAEIIGRPHRVRLRYICKFTRVCLKNGNI